MLQMLLLMLILLRLAPPQLLLQQSPTTLVFTRSLPTRTNQCIWKVRWPITLVILEPPRPHKKEANTKKYGKIFNHGTRSDPELEQEEQEQQEPNGQLPGLGAPQHATLAAHGCDAEASFSSFDAAHAVDEMSAAFVAADTPPSTAACGGAMLLVAGADAASADVGLTGVTEVADDVNDNGEAEGEDDVFLEEACGQTGELNTEDELDYSELAATVSGVCLTEQHEALPAVSAEDDVDTHGIQCEAVASALSLCRADASGGVDAGALTCDAQTAAISGPCTLQASQLAEVARRYIYTSERLGARTQATLNIAADIIRVEASDRGWHAEVAALAVATVLKEFTC